MMRTFLKRGFTLMEVNLAVFIMAVGVLGMVALYPLGYREGQQSQDDVAGAALADAILNPLAAALSSTNVLWSEWRNLLGDSIGDAEPNGGWAGYCRDRTHYIPNSRNAIRSTAESTVRRVVSGLTLQENPQAQVIAAIGDIVNNYKVAPALVATYGIVKNQNGAEVVDKSRIILSCRSVRRGSSLFSQPVYCTEIHFQGDPDR